MLSWGAMLVSSSSALGRFRYTRVNREPTKWVELRALLCQNSHGYLMNDLGSRHRIDERRQLRRVKN